MNYLYILVIITIFFPLLGSVFSGFFGNLVTKRTVILVSLCTMLLATVAGFILFSYFYNESHKVIEFTLYSWCYSGTTSFEVGFLIDRLTTLMFVVVLFVSLMVHIYTKS
jgi:NADH-quinone oxidoreductase subunit L